MKRIIIFASTLALLSIMSCTKAYNCVCSGGTTTVINLPDGATGKTAADLPVSPREVARGWES